DGACLYEEPGRAVSERKPGYPPVIAGRWLPLRCVLTVLRFTDRTNQPPFKGNSRKMAVPRQKARIFSTFSESDDPSLTSHGSWMLLMVMLAPSEGPRIFALCH